MVTRLTTISTINHLKLCENMETTKKENDRITKMEGSLEDIKTDVSEIKSALIGNPLSGEKGVVGQVGSLKTEIDYLKKDIKELQLEKERTGQAIKIISGVAIVFLAALIKLFFDKL